MLVYSGVKSDFMRSVEEDTIAQEIARNIYEKMKRRTVKNEFRSWQNSMQYMYKVLNDRSIPDNSGVAIEYNIPQTAKRIDFILSGYGADLAENVVIIELKQWDSLEALPGEDALVNTYTGGTTRRVVHPSYQAWTYASLIYDYNQTVQEGNVHLFPCTYLHNYLRALQDDPLDALQYKPYYDIAPAFTNGQVKNLRRFICSHVTRGDDEAVIQEVDSGKIRPSKSLQDSLVKMMQGNQEFVMVDEQKVVYESVLQASRRCVQDGKKRVIIVQGGPGTGKTVVAINLLVQLITEDQVCQYVSKNSAPRNIYLKKLKGQFRNGSMGGLFRGSGSFVSTPENTFGTILADEAHRLNSKSGIYHNMGENQIKEIIHAARCSVFFIDESQRVTLDDIGSTEEIRHWADLAGAEISEMELISQFRCDGSDGYLAWLDHVLGIRETANWDLEGVDYDFRVMDTPEELRDLIFDLNEKTGNRARILAGYCWDWKKEGKNDPNWHDIQIGEFGMSWNLNNTSTYAIDPDSVNEIGCIHTAQGLEFDYVGVIIGDDLRYEDGQIVTDFTKRAKTDTSLRGIKKLYQSSPLEALQRADEIIKNTYRTLMTRGMKGCYVYCTDSALAQYLRENLGQCQR